VRSRLINAAPERIFAVVFEHGDLVMPALLAFAREQGLAASRLSAIGAFEEATLGYFEWQRKDYERIPVREQVEVLSFLGDVALDGDEPKLHVHVVLGRRDGSTVGGHLLEARVRPTLEVLVTDSPAHLRRVHDPESRLALIRPDVEPPAPRPVPPGPDVLPAHEPLVPGPDVDPGPGPGDLPGTPPAERPPTRATASTAATSHPCIGPDG
jgi:predicted DNA-binding protein with PD1-like motif